MPDFSNISSINRYLASWEGERRQAALREQQARGSFFGGFGAPAPAGPQPRPTIPPSGPMQGPQPRPTTPPQAPQSLLDQVQNNWVAPPPPVQGPQPRPQGQPWQQQLAA